jgi:hypothetical protein
MSSSKEHGGPTFDFTVDGEPFSTSEHVLTPTQIMQIAAIDPATHYIVEIHGHDQHSYEGQPNAEIHMHEHAKFIANSSGPTPVS